MMLPPWSSTWKDMRGSPGLVGVRHWRYMNSKEIREPMKEDLESQSCMHILWGLRMQESTQGQGCRPTGMWASLRRVTQQVLCPPASIKQR